MEVWKYDKDCNQFRQQITHKDVKQIYQKKPIYGEFEIVWYHPRIYFG